MKGENGFITKKLMQDYVLAGLLLLIFLYIKRLMTFFSALHNEEIYSVVKSKRLLRV